MAYIPLGYRPVIGKLDTTGQNTGNYTCVFDQTVTGANVSVFEVYHLFLTAPVLTGGNTEASVMLNNGYWDVTLTGQANGWDPAQPLLMIPGDTLFVLFNVPVPSTPVPTVTAWLRYQNS